MKMRLMSCEMLVTLLSSDDFRIVVCNMDTTVAI